MVPSVDNKSIRSSASLNTFINSSNLAPIPATLQVLKYTKNNLEQIFKTVLESRTPALKKFDKPQEKPLKAKVPDVYRSKFYKDYYNFFQQYKNHFTMSGARGLNQVAFIATFFKQQALFRQQQYKQKFKANTIALIVWDNFKIFLHQHLDEYRVFVDRIQKKIRTASQYQLEKVIDQVTHLEYLLAILKKVNITAAPNKDFLI